MDRNKQQEVINSVITKRFRWLLNICLVVSVILIGLAIDRANTRNFVSAQRAAVLNSSETARARIETKLVSGFLVSRGLRTMISVDPEITQAEFAEFANQLKLSNPEIVRITAAPDLVTAFVYPLEGNEDVLGFDLRSSPQQLATIATAQSVDKPVIGPPVELAQGRVGIDIQEPVYLRKGQGDPHFWGTISVRIDIGMLLRGTGLPNGHAVAIRSINADGQPDGAICGDQNLFLDSPVLKTVALPYGAWQLALTPVSGWPTRAADSSLVWAVVLALGFLSIVALNALLNFREEKANVQRRLTDAIETIDDGFAIYDADDRFVMCNSKYRQIYRKSANLLVPGRSFADILRGGIRLGQYPAAVGREREWLQEQLAARRDPLAEQIEQLEDGRWLRVADRKTPEGWTVGFRVDITELVLARDAAEAADRAKTDFLSNVNHEMRTPLSVIQGYNAFLRKPEFLPSYAPLMAGLGQVPLAEEKLKTLVENLLADVTSYADKIQRSSQTLLVLISNSLDISPGASGHVVLRRDRLKVAQITTAIIQKHRTAAQAKGIELSADRSDGEVYGDKERVTQILDILVSNAVKFTDRGSVTIKVERCDEYVTIAVQDTGIGISEAQQIDIFKPFQQGDASETRSFGGTGIGLAVSKKLVEMHGGDLKLTSTRNVGSTFTFTIPAWRESHGQAAQRRKRAAGGHFI